MPEVFIETNIRSVFIHHFFPGARSVSDAQLLPLVEQALDRQNPRMWYSALMDYGVHLKETFPNPSRKSRHYTRQSRFQGSDRQVRAQIVRMLLKEPATVRCLEKAVAVDRQRLRRIIAALVKDRLIFEKKRALAIAE